MEIKEAFAVSRLLRAVNPPTLAMLASVAVLRPLKRGEIVFRDKEQAGVLYIVAEGLAALYKSSENGERRVMFLYGAGETLNEVAVSSAPASVSCQTLQDSLFLCLPMDSVRWAMEQDFSFSKAMMDAMALKIRRLYHQMKNTSGSLRGDKRAAAKLLKLARDFGVPCSSGTMLDFDLSITFLADMLGAKRETVSRQLKQLSDAGLIRYQAGRFVIPDRDALQKYYTEP